MFKASGLLVSSCPGQSVSGIRDQVETPRVAGFRAAGFRVVAAIRDQVATPKLEDCKPSGLLVSRCPGQGVSGNEGPSGNP